MKNTLLYKDILCEQNIFVALYSLESYIFEVGLLSKNDQILFHKLHDKFNTNQIKKVIKLCQNRLETILTTSEVFDLEVYFKLKKFDQESGAMDFRPMHTTNLIDQICLVCLLMPLMFTRTDGSYHELSDLSKSIPSNFYGNMPSLSIERIFCDWRTKYKEYSENVIALYNESKETGKYQFEVCLDIKDYFPSVNPSIIFNLVLNKLSIYHKDKEYDCLKTVLRKLLYFRISNISENYSQYSRKIENKVLDESRVNSEFYSIGIPQGLPQAYFFGNLCMVEISKIYREIFDGESFFYVDDSVIYSNSHYAKPQNFTESIDIIEQKINSSLKNHADLNEHSKDIPDSIIEFHNGIGYSISIHKGIKSTTSDIRNEDKFGMSFLKSIAIDASRTNSDIYSTINELQDDGLKEKIETLKTAIENEIVHIDDKYKNKVETVSGYLKLLKRYKKFFLYRLRIMEYREKIDLDEKFKIFAEKFMISEKEFSKQALSEIFDLFDEDLFIAEVQMMLNFCNNGKMRKIYIDSVKNFEIRITKGFLNGQNYFCKVLNYQAEDKKGNYEYTSLKKLCSRKIRNYSKVDTKIQREELLNLIRNSGNYENANIIKHSNIRQVIGFVNSYDNYIFSNSNRYQRYILNSIVSSIINVEISNDISLYKMDSRLIKYYELRILMYIRNNNSDLKSFFLFAEKLLLEVKGELNNEIIDYSINEVLWCFKTFVKDPEKIDGLILAHKLVAGLWKNGSKHFYFYTLHNQEHSISLINLSVDIVKSIDFIQLKKFDYYVLFLSCYFHDISMVFIPGSELFLNTQLHSDSIYSKWRRELKDIMKLIEDNSQDEKLESKKFILKYYEEIEAFFEKNMRDNHAYTSAEFIRKSNSLEFINPAEKSFVANISESHYFEAPDIYGLKSKARTNVLNEKYLMIILRLADLMDMTSDRVSLNILKNNIRKMPVLSQCHWISHAAIDKCLIHSEYSINENAIKEDKKSSQFESNLSKKYLSEIIVIDLDLNTRDLSRVSSKECLNAKSDLKNGGKQIVLSINSVHNREKCSSKCSYICKWMFTKNEYLYSELSELLSYIENCSSNIFSTNIEVRLNFNNIIKLQSEYHDIISQWIDVQ